MTIAISTSPAQPAGVPALPGLQGAATGDVFALLMNVGASQAPASTEASVQPAASAVADPVVPVAVGPVEDATILVKAADALISSLAPAKEVEDESAAKPAPAQIAQILAKPADGRTRETPAPEKKEGRGKAKNAGDETQKTPDAPEASLPSILIALPAVGDTPEATPVPASEPETLAIAVTAAPVKTDRTVSLPRPAKDLPTIFKVDGGAVTAAATNAPPAPAKSDPLPAADVPAPQIKAPAPIADLPVDAKVQKDTGPAQPVSAPVSAEPVQAETVVAVEIPAAPKSGKPVPAAPAAKASEVQKPLPGAERPAIAIDAIITPAPVHAGRVMPTDTPIIQPAVQTTAIAAAPADALVDRQLDLVRNEQWLGELARDIASSTGDNQKLNFRLMPPQLGRLDVDLSRSHHGLSLTIRTETDSAQAILTAAQPRLVEEMRAQGVKLADTQMFSGDMRQSSSQNGQAQPAPALIEAFIPPAETEEPAHEDVRDGRYA